MTLHPRTPAIIALVLTACAGVGLLAATGQFRTTDLAHATVADLEKKVAGSQDGSLWLAYGNKLLEGGNPQAAAKAFQKAIGYQPDLVDARLNLGLALGEGPDTEAFFDYVSRLSVNYPKLADDLLKRPELNSLHGHARWEPAVISSRAQALD